jgi:hypothetical protein
VQYVLGAIEVEWTNEGLCIGTGFERLHAVESEHAHVLAQVAPADDVPAALVVHDAIWVDRALRLLVAGSVAHPDAA